MLLMSGSSVTDSYVLSMIDSSMMLTAHSASSLRCCCLLCSPALFLGTFFLVEFLGTLKWVIFIIMVFGDGISENIDSNI